MAPPSQRLRRLLPLLGGTLIVALVVVGLLWLIREMRQESGGPKRPVAQQVQLIRPQPPPEKPPEPEPPPPEEKIEEPLPQETPEEAPPEEAAPADQPALDAEGVAGTDGFGLAGKKGGRDLIGGNGGAMFAWYTSGLKDRIFEMLADDEKIRRAKYQVTFRVWVRSDGAIEQIKFQSTSGDRAVDQAIEEALQRIKRAPDAPPLEMPQPITFRIVSK